MTALAATALAVLADGQESGDAGAGLSFFLVGITVLVALIVVIGLIVVLRCGMKRN